MLPFSRDAFLALFAQYNIAIWPAHLIAYALGALVLLLALWPRRGSDRFISAVLAGAWLWMGVVYHMMFSTSINLAAWAFGAAFVVQGLLFAWTGGMRRRLVFRFVPTLRGWVGLMLVVLSMAVYPLVGLATDHGWPRTPMFGVAPCPTALFTLGLLLLSVHRVPLHVLVVPVLWTFVAGIAAWQLGVHEDMALPLAGLSVLCFVLWQNRKLAVDAN